jgi:predicted RNA-binding protein with PUA-like domain
VPRRLWLFKSEPTVFSIDDLAKAPKKTTGWEGVRNYQARNRLRDEVRKGDGVLFYHSSCDVPGVAGTCVVAREAHVDPHQFDPKSAYFDPKAKRDAPPWLLVDVKLERRFREPVTLERIKATPALAKMDLLRRGNRLSIQPVSEAEWKAILVLAGANA